MGISWYIVMLQYFAYRITYRTWHDISYHMTSYLNSHHVSHLSCGIPCILQTLFYRIVPHIITYRTSYYIVVYYEYHIPFCTWCTGYLVCTRIYEVLHSSLYRSTSFVGASVLHIVPKYHCITSRSSYIIPGITYRTEISCLLYTSPSPRD